MKKLVFALTLYIAGCATSSPKEVATAVPQKSEPKMLVAGMTLEQLSSGSCPQTLPKGETAVSDYMKWGSSCAKSGQWNRVEEIGNALSIKYSAYPWGAYFLSVHAEHAKDLPRARWMAELAIKKAPSEGLVLYQLGRLQWAMEERSAALDTLTKAVDKNPTLVEANVILGQIALLTDKNSDAGKRFQKALEYNSKHMGALMGMAEVSTRNKNWAETERFLRSAISAAPRSLEVRMRLASGLETIGKNNAGALEVYREILKLDRDHKLDASPSFDLSAKVHVLQTSVNEEMKRRVSERTPSAEGERKVSK